MAQGLQGADELTRALSALPENIQRRVARAWVKRWSAVAWAATISEAPKGKTGNLLGGIVRRDTSKAVITRLRSLARAVVIGKKPAFHFHLVILGTQPRYTGQSSSKRGKGRKTVLKPGARRAFRGVMPANDFTVRAVRPLMAPAEQDLRVRLDRALQRMLRRGGG